MKPDEVARMVMDNPLDWGDEVIMTVHPRWELAVRRVISEYLPDRWNIRLLVNPYLKNENEVSLSWEAKV